MNASPSGGPRRLYRSRIDRKLGGVCGGIADYLGIDPVVVRLVWVGMTIVSFGAGILLYIVALLVVPEDPRQTGPLPV